MTFSVVIPAYNCAETIENTIEDVQRSGLYDHEIIIVNDGSADGTGAKLEQLKNRYSNLVVITKQNGGASSARNLGIDRAAGEYLLFVDADDRIDRDAYRHAVELVAQTQPDMLMFGMRFEYYAWKTCYQIENKICPTEGLFSSEEAASMTESLFVCNYLSSACSRIIRRELLDRFGIRFSEEMFLLEDAKFSMECFRRCRTVYLLPEAIYRYELKDNDNRNARRVRRIDSVQSYLRHFSQLPETFSGVRKQICDMLLYQRIRTAKTVRTLKAESEALKESPYASVFEDRAMVRDLLNGRFRTLLLRNRYYDLRHKLVVLYKVLRRRLTGKL